MNHIKNCPCNRCLDWKEPPPISAFWTNDFRIVEMANDEFVLQIMSPYTVGWVEIYRNTDLKIVRDARGKVDSSYQDSQNTIKRVIE